MVKPDRIPAREAGQPQFVIVVQCTSEVSVVSWVGEIFFFRKTQMSPETLTSYKHKPFRAAFIPLIRSLARRSCFSASEYDSWALNKAEETLQAKKRQRGGAACI